MRNSSKDSLIAFAVRADTASLPIWNVAAANSRAPHAMTRAFVVR
jgi:hypothetical protein